MFRTPRLATTTARFRRCTRGGSNERGGLAGLSRTVVRRDRKAWQLCRQVAVTLDEVLAECGDGVLRGLHVVSVAPFPDASRLLVTLTSIDDRPGGVIGAGSVLEHLEHATGHFRCEIAVGRYPQTRAGLGLPVGRTQGGRDRRITIHPRSSRSLIR